MRRVAPALVDAARIAERATLVDLFASSGLVYVAGELVDRTLDAVDAVQAVLPEVDRFRTACAMVALVHVDLRERHGR